MLSRLKAATLVAVTATTLLAGAVTGAVSQSTGSDGVTYQADWRWDSAPLTADGADS
ncbi:hypothetical protein ABT034_03085 [Streptomyces sp. NPDC002773]|uniref:hypothetical protein n=1 Tax=Streptomyces sp. NPDC002773 TaxID=3154430 RepID=UPI0033272DDD